jgi:NAD(P)-dependent dehydrogenase (short-subunit alcohol dehydrogenase family)
MNQKTGQQAASSLNGTFHKTNVTNYSSLSTTFEKTFQEFGQIDFVFANAGIVERDNFYAKFPDSGPPVRINAFLICVDSPHKSCLRNNC